MDYSNIVENVINNFTEPTGKKIYILKDSDLIKESLEAIEERMVSGGDIPGMKTGFRDFDKSIGGLQRGELNIIAGRPSMGKTLFALNLGDGLGDNGFNILLCELEISVSLAQ